MDVVLGVSVTDRTARIALVGGSAADGDVIDQVTVPLPVGASEGSAGEIVETVLGTSKLLTKNGHRLAATGLVWNDDAAAAVVRDALAGKGVNDVVLIAEDIAVARAAEAVAGQDKSEQLSLSKDDQPATAADAPEFAVARGAALAAPGALADDAPATGATVATSALSIAIANLAAAEAKPETAEGAAVGSDAAESGLDSAGLPPLTDVDAITELQPQLAYSMVDPQPETDAEAGFATQFAPAYPADGQSVSGWSPAAAALETDDPGPAPAAVKRGRRPVLLVGSALVGIVVAGVTAMAVTAVIGVDPTADQRDSNGTQVELPVNESAGTVDEIQGQPGSAPPEAIPDAPEIIEAPQPVAVVEPAPVQSVPAPQAPAVEPAPQVVAPAPQVAAPAPQVAAPAPVVPQVPAVQPQVPVVQPPEIYLPDIDLNLPDFTPNYTPDSSIADATVPDTSIVDSGAPSIADATVPDTSFPVEPITPFVPDFPTVEDFLPEIPVPDSSSSGSTPTLPIFELPSIFG